MDRGAAAVILASVNFAVLLVRRAAIIVVHPGKRVAMGSAAIQVNFAVEVAAASLLAIFVA